MLQAQRKASVKALQRDWLFGMLGEYHSREKVAGDVVRRTGDRGPNRPWSILWILF